jgi:hypothetical protein
MVIYILLIFLSLQSFCSDQTGQTGMPYRSDRYVCPETQFCNSEFIYPRPWSLFVPEGLCLVCTSLISGKAEIMSSGRPSIQYYEKRMKSHQDVDADEGCSRNPPLRRSTRATSHMDLLRGSMDINLKIEEEEHIVESSDDDDVEDESYMISPRATRESVLDDDEDETMDDDNEIEDELRRQVEEEEEEGAEGIANPQQRGRTPFHPKPTIRRPHKPLSYNAICYSGKGTTKEVKRLRKIDPRSQQKGALDYMFHTQFQQDLYETVIMVRRRIVSEAQWVD